MDGGRGRRGRGAGTRVTADLSPAREAALRALYDWRDATARREDESTLYVCHDAALQRIASNRPATAAALRHLVNPLPPLVMRRSQEILDAVRRAATATGEEARAPRAEHGGRRGDAAGSGTAAAAAPPPPPASARNRDMLSPVLGSQALYQQAGWMTPAGGHSAISESEDDEGGIQKFLGVDAVNEGYATAPHPSHGIEMSPPRLESEPNDAKGGTSRRGASTDGLGTVRVALGGNAGAAASVQEEIRAAQRSAGLIRRDVVRATGGGEGGAFAHGFSLIDLIRPAPLPAGADLARERDDGRAADRGDGAPGPGAEEEGGEGHASADQGHRGAPGTRASLAEVLARIKAELK